jgi:hypothetical protein
MMILQGLGVGPSIQFHQGHHLPQQLHEADQWYASYDNHICTLQTPTLHDDDADNVGDGLLVSIHNVVI